MSSGKTFIICYFLFSFASSCALYKPTLTPNSELNDKGDLEVASALSLKNPLSAYIAYSPIKNVGLFANVNVGYTTTNNSADTISTLFADTSQLSTLTDPLLIPKYRFSNRQFEFAAGSYFMLFDDFRLDTYLGYGFGLASTSLDDYIFERSDEFNASAGAIQANFRKYFIQSSLITDFDQYMKLIFGLRVTQLNFYHFKSRINYAVFDRYVPETKRQYNSAKFDAK